MEFEKRRKIKFEVVGKFVEKIKKIQEKVKAVLKKAQEEIKRYANQKQEKAEEYKIRDLVLLSTKDLKWQMVRRGLEKLTKQFVELYKVKGIVSTNAIELELPSSIKIHSVVNISQVWLYRPQVEEQKKILPKPVIIEREEKFEMEKILNKRVVKGKKKFLVQWEEYIVEGDTWESRKNLKNG